MADHHQLSNFIWQIADLLRGPYRPPQYERVMLPMVVLRRFDCVLKDTKPAVLARHDQVKERLKDDALDGVLNKVAGQRFHNHSRMDFEKLKGDPDRINEHLSEYIQSFSKNVRDIFVRFDFGIEIERMHEANILYLIISKFCDIDLHPDNVDNIEMGLIFEDLIRRFNEAANETAGDHFTPREVIALMVDILFDPDDEVLTTPGKVFRLLDPACGTGGMLSEAQKHLRDMHAENQLWVFGQDFNQRSYAIAASDLLMKGNPNSEIALGDSLIDDRFDGKTFDYFLANPPFGVDWKKQQSAIKKEHGTKSQGRFKAGLPRVNDGSLLFLQHMISKFEPYNPAQGQHGSRLGIVFNGSPLFTGGAGSGESEIRRWIIENDWLEAIVALPEQMFYNTGIGTYIWIVTNRKEAHRRGKIQLIDARGEEFYIPMRRSLGDKRRKIGGADEGEPDQIGHIVRLYGDFRENQYTKIFDNHDFGYNRVTIERPLRLVYEMSLDRKSRFLDAVPHLLDDVQAIDKELGRQPRTNWNEFSHLMDELLKHRESRWRKDELRLFRIVFTDPQIEDGVAPVIDKVRKAEGDPAEARVWGWFPHPEKARMQAMYEAYAPLRDFENVDLAAVCDEERNQRRIIDYFNTQVEPHVKDGWADRESIRPAYEINFNRYFYEYTPPRPLAEIDADLKRMEEKIVRLLREVTA